MVLTELCAVHAALDILSESAHESQLCPNPPAASRRFSLTS